MMYLSKQVKFFEYREYAENHAHENCDWGQVIEVPVDLSTLAWWHINDSGEFWYLVKGETEYRKIKL